MIPTRPIDVLVWWTEDEYGKTGGSSQPATFTWPAGYPLPEVGDSLRAPQGASPLDRGRVRVLERTWEWGYGSGGPVVVLRLDCEWVGW